MVHSRLIFIEISETLFPFRLRVQHVRKPAISYVHTKCLKVLVRMLKISLG